MVIVREGSSSFYLRTPDEYRKLATMTFVLRKQAGMPTDKALLAVAGHGFALQKSPRRQPGRQPRQSQASRQRRQASEPAAQLSKTNRHRR